MRKFKHLALRAGLYAGLLGTALAPLHSLALPNALAGSTVINETFTSSAGGFSVVSGGTWAVSGGQYVLTNPSNASVVNSNLAIHNTKVTGDFTLTVDGKATPTTNVWNDFSVVFSYQDAQNYHYVSFSESNDGLTKGIFKVTNGMKTQLADITAAFTAGTLYRVKVERTGSTLKAFLNGTLVATASSATPATGQVGVGSQNDGAAFDNVNVTLASASYKLSWAPPALTNATTVNVTNADRSINLDKTRDYVLVIKEKLLGGLSIHGGRNVVLIGGHIEIQRVTDRRGLFLDGWTGTMHVEGLLIDGEHLGDAVVISTGTAGTILQLQNVRTGKVHGTPEEAACYTCPGVYHPDVLQNYGGPTYYRIDRLTGSTNYQGLMVQPEEFGTSTVLADFRNMNITSDGAYFIYRASGTQDFVLTNVWFYKAQGTKYGYPENDPEWAAIKKGLPPGGDFVPAGSVGMNYVSPGYAN
ncbi:hypothetical protein JQX13_07350 [Archangium violaceum]|uniref:hypothetical protein n=1 Tax=Archangium violaceum TaxID=83451 RepID=UPI00193B8E33|nr:hypothetical protein [Archangium violaceum]QRK09911.1 hypothetical protein JQX13_07350 [Archangium violaceum]